MTLSTLAYPPETPAFKQLVLNQVALALAEDIGSGDLTAQLLPAAQLATASIVVRENAIICGIAWVNACFKHLDPNVTIIWLIAEGERVHPNQVLCEISGAVRALLTAERCALNFLQTLSATATETRKYVEAVAGTNTQILDTRKTIPHLRLAQKYAVSIGGGHNQRLALYDGILIKENHITAAGSIDAVIQQALTLDGGAHIQIEVENLVQLEQALDASATSILLDNFSVDLLRAAVKINVQRGKLAILEASGGISLDNVLEIAMTGVDRISIGALTKHVHAIDFSMRIGSLIP